MTDESDFWSYECQRRVLVSEDDLWVLRTHRDQLATFLDLGQPVFGDDLVQQDRWFRERLSWANAEIARRCADKYCPGFLSAETGDG